MNKDSTGALYVSEIPVEDLYVSMYDLESNEFVVVHFDARDKEE